MSKQNKSELSYLNTQGVTKIIQRNGNNDYTIIPIDSYEQAHKYCEYTTWSSTRCQYEFDRYTKGGKRLYFCLKDGFENTPKNDEGAPLNDYGLSMISVKVDTNGDVLDMITRYNRDFDDTDKENLYTPNQLEDILDVHFYSVFLPYTRDELHSRGVILFDEVQGLLDSGKNPEDIFDKVYDFYNGYARVKLNNKWNWISADNRLVSSNQWYDEDYDFNEGYAVVQLNNKYNWIDTKCNYLTEQWFEYCDSFSNGYSRIKLKNKYNWINKENKLLFPNKWFEYCLSFNEGYASVILNDKCNWIDTNGNYLTEQWFDYCDNFEEGYAIVKLNGKYNWIDKNRKYLSEQWFDDVYIFNNGYSNVKLNGKWNIIDKNGNYISEQWSKWRNVFNKDMQTFV